MKVVFDAYWWYLGPPSLRHVLRETVLEWNRQFPGDRIVLVVCRKHFRQFGPDSKELDFRESRWWPQALLAVIAVPTRGRKERADFVYTQNFAAGFGDRSAVFIHDVMFETNPEWFTRVELVYFRWMTRLAKRARLVFTSSRNEARRIEVQSGAKHVTAVGIGMSEELKAAAPVRPLLHVEPKRFLLSVGRLNVRKNLGMTIRAAVATRMLSLDRPLVVVGAPDGRLEELDAETGRAVRDGQVIFSGKVSDAELSWLYQNTEIFVFLTKGEGFGMPAVEALWFGAPMLVSDITVFREILPSSVPRVDPDNLHLITARMSDVLAHPVVLRTGGDYEWSRTVRLIREELAKCLET